MLIYRIITLILIACIALAQLEISSEAQEIIDNADQLDPELFATINNYFGCKTWDNGICLECAQRFYFNEKGICC